MEIVEQLLQQLLQKCDRAQNCKSQNIRKSVPPLLAVTFGKHKISVDREVAQNCKSETSKKNIAAIGFDPMTFGLWAQHASTAPSRSISCWLYICLYFIYLFMCQLYSGIC